jgi:hypothetical protein
MTISVPDTDTDTDTDKPQIRSSPPRQVQGPVPASLQVMAGEAVNPGAGFHKIALQIAITGNALGKKEDEILAACEGLIEKHQSEGHRYNTPVKRRNEIARLLPYTEGNPAASTAGAPCAPSSTQPAFARPGRGERGGVG